MPRKIRYALIGAGVVLLALIIAGAYFRQREMARQAAIDAQVEAARAEALKASAPPPPSVIAEAESKDPPVTVQVMAARRVTPDTLRVELTFISRASAPEPIDLAAGKGLSVEDLCLLTADGSRRLFALRDAEDKPVGEGSFDPLKPDERRAIWALFPAPPPSDSHVTLLVGSLMLQNVPIS